MQGKNFKLVFNAQAVNTPTSRPYAYFKICFPKCPKYYPESESDGCFCRVTMCNHRSKKK